MRYLAFFLALVLAPATLHAQSKDPIADLYNAQRYEEAFALAQQRAEAGDVVANSWLGLMYERGRGTQPNIPAAEANFRLAAAAGGNYALWRLGVLIDQGKVDDTLEQAVAFFRQCAEQDYANCVVSLAVMHATGRGTPKDSEAALATYLRAAQMGDAGGIRGVGVMLLLGEGVPKDPVEAAAWFLLSAALGNTQSEANFKTVLDDLEDVDYTTIAERAKAIAESLDVPSDNIRVEEEAP